MSLFELFILLESISSFSMAMWELLNLTERPLRRSEKVLPQVWATLSFLGSLTVALAIGSFVALACLATSIAAVVVCIVTLLYSRLETRRLSC